MRKLISYVIPILVLFICFSIISILLNGRFLSSDVLDVIVYMFLVILKFFITGFGGLMFLILSKEFLLRRRGVMDIFLGSLSVILGVLLLVFFLILILENPTTDCIAGARYC